MANTENKREHYEQESLFDFKDYNGGKLSRDNYIKSPLNYVGGKFKLLPQIMPLFPENISTFVDLFSGGANVGINVEASTIVFNDTNYRVNNIFRHLQTHSIEDTLDEIYNYIDEYKLSKTNKDGFLAIRRDYNNSSIEKPMMLYTLSSYSFQNQFRFNSEGKYNNPFGKRAFSNNMQNNLIQFSNRLKSINAKFIDKDFGQIDFSKLDKKSFIYADPPYLITDATYNKGWNIAEENKLYQLLDGLNDRDIKFGLSDVLTHKGKENKTLIEWSKKYNIHHLNYSYENSSYNTKKAPSDEVFITNY